MRISLLLSFPYPRPHKVLTMIRCFGFVTSDRELEVEKKGVPGTIKVAAALGEL